MNDCKNLICIYDDTKEDLTQLLLNIYAKFVEKELDYEDESIYHC